MSFRNYSFRFDSGDFFACIKKVQVPQYDFICLLRELLTLQTQKSTRLATLQYLNRCQMSAFGPWHSQ